MLIKTVTFSANEAWYVRVAIKAQISEYTTSARRCRNAGLRSLARGWLARGYMLRCAYRKLQSSPLTLTER